MKQRRNKKALGWIGQARLWPENVGVGEPYPENEDLRLEDWMSYRCYVALRQDAEAKEALQRIIRLQPRIDNTVPNFIPANAVISAWAREKAEAGVRSAGGAGAGTAAAGGAAGVAGGGGAGGGGLAGGGG